MPKFAKKSPKKATAVKKRGSKAYPKRYTRYSNTKSSVPSLLSNGGYIELRRGYDDALILAGDDDSLVVNNSQATAITWLNTGFYGPDIGHNQRQWGAAVNCSLSDLPAASDVFNLFSQYKMGPTEFTFTLESGDSAVAYTGAPPVQVGSQAPGCPHIYYYFDSSDGIPTGPMNNVVQRGNLKHHLLTNNNPLTLRHTLRPNIMSEIPGAISDNFFGAVFDKSPWMKCMPPSAGVGNYASHYGTHFYVRNFGGPFSQCRIRITATQILYLRYPQ